MTTAPGGGAVLAVGVDLVEISRILQVMDRHPERFLSRHFTAKEQADCDHRAERLAARWAAKEAAAKALGTGIGPVGWQEIEIVCRANGAPILHLRGQAAALADRLGWSAWSVSLSHTHGHAMAVVVAAG